MDLKVFWNDTPENYAKLLKKSYQVIKKANPNARVLIAGMAASYDYYFAILKELDRIKEKADEKYFDIYNFHLYNFEDDFIKRLNNHLERIKSELLKYGYDVPLWLTETGDCSGGYSG